MVFLLFQLFVPLRRSFLFLLLFWGGEDYDQGFQVQRLRPSMWYKLSLIRSSSTGQEEDDDVSTKLALPTREAACVKLGYMLEVVLCTQYSQVLGLRRFAG